ncbi:unnamed protein product, partial [Mesorhabditis belari]|uniref:Major facilitator superfamily (MFS) profile domain-containing protein n=1 Tax=Mesorhabditis belari TaxID=2138241 RepID=A0AAF3E8J1_9BILA
MGYYNANRFHYVVLLTWQLAIFLATQMLFSIFANYTPKWKCGEDDHFDTNCTIFTECKGNLVFEEPAFNSVVMEFQNFCDGNTKNTYLRNYSQMVFVGVFFGTVFFGWLADVHGRKPISLLVFGGCVVFNGASAFIQSPNTLLVMRAVIGFTVGGVIVVVCTYCNELLLPQQRIMMRAFFNWGTGRMLQTLLCYLFPDWRRATLAISAAAFPAILSVLFILPESPIWLHNKGKYVLMKESEEKIAKFAGRAHIPIEHKKVEKSKNIIEMISSKKTLGKLWVLGFMWWCSATCSYANDLNSGSLSGNFYLNQFLFGLIIYFSKWVMAWADKEFPNFSRRRLHQMSQIAVCVCFLIMIILLSFGRKGLFLTILNIIGCVCIEFTWDANQLCAVESLPTACRASAVGSCSLVARIGSLLAPFIAFSAQFWSPAVYVTVFILGAINFFVAFFWLTETKNINLESLDVDEEEKSEQNEKRLIDGENA